MKQMRGQERLSDNLSFRLTQTQRKFLEQLSSERGVSIADGARAIVDEAMLRAGAEKCQ